jgi:tetratricopeptide (TPR) repeat protein
MASEEARNPDITLYCSLHESLILISENRLNDALSILPKAHSTFSDSMSIASYAYKKVEKSIDSLACSFLSQICQFEYPLPHRFEGCPALKTARLNSNYLKALSSYSEDELARLSSEVTQLASSPESSSQAVKKKLMLFSAFRYWAGQQYAKAEIIFSKLLHSTPSQLKDLIFWSVAALKCGNFDVVVQSLTSYFSNAQNLPTKDKEYFRLLGHILLSYAGFKTLEKDQFSFTSARNEMIFQSIVQNLTANPQIQYHHIAPYILGHLYQKRNDHISAIKMFTLILSRNPKHFAALLSRADSQMYLRNFKDAISDIERISRFFPSSSLLSSTLTILRRMEKNDSTSLTIS